MNNFLYSNDGEDTRNLERLEERERKERNEYRRITFRVWINSKQRNKGGENERDKDRLLNRDLKLSFIPTGKPHLVKLFVMLKDILEARIN